MKTIGGYFELELPCGNEYHENAICLNTGRNAFEYILRAKRYKKVYVPYFTCNVVLEPINTLKLTYKFYHVDSSFRPIFDFGNLEHDDVFLYTNYFGICDKIVLEISKKCNNLIVDNAQAFYSKPLIGVDTFYSPRKFFGLPDGAYLYTNKFIKSDFEQDYSEDRFKHLIGRIERGPQLFYQNSKQNESSLSFQPIKLMSKVTRRLLNSIDYASIAAKRRNNFEYLHMSLKSSNKLVLELSEKEVPLVYPYWLGKNELWNKLAENNIFTARYWSNVKDWCDSTMLEHKFSEQVVYLPVDQRYSKEDMKDIINFIYQ